MRWLVILVTGLLAVRFSYGFVVHDAITIHFDLDAINTLWQRSDTSRGVLSMFIVPGLLLVLAISFWLQRLFRLFQQGHFFGDQSMRCFLWLVWLNFAAYMVDTFSGLFMGLYGQSFDSTIQPEIGFDITGFFTMLLLIVIVYLLKAAKQLEQENQEFI